MKFAHISDLHIGKALHGFSLIEDQRHILAQIAEKLTENGVDALVIAGDVYDKGIASVEAIGVFRKFLNDLVGRNIRVLAVSGNHDSAERLTFGSEFMTGDGIYFSDVYDGNVKPVVLEDEYGPVNFYLLPFVKPAVVRHVFPDEEIDSYHSAVRCALGHIAVNVAERNVMVSHQNVTRQSMESFSEEADDSKYAGSEERSIGGLDAVGADLFAAFDYTALGHIHKRFRVGETVWFCGAPLKYSVDERNDDKSMTIVTLAEKGNVRVEKIPLVPLRNLRQMEGSFDEIMSAARDAANQTAVAVGFGSADAGGDAASDSDGVSGTAGAAGSGGHAASDDYVSVVLTDAEMREGAMPAIRHYYPNALEIRYRNDGRCAGGANVGARNVSGISPMRIFEEFYRTIRNDSLNEAQRAYMNDLIARVWEEKS